MSAILSIAFRYLNQMSESEFKEYLSKKNFWKQFEPYLAFVPDSYRAEIEKISSAELETLLKKHSAKKAKIITSLKKWQEIKKGFEQLKKKL